MLWAIAPLHAQKDTLLLSEVLIVDSAVLFFSSNEISERIGHTHLNLRSNGPEALTTLSFRGGSSSHLSIRWNGVDIQSPMLGQLDASLIDFAFFDQVQCNAQAADRTNSGISGNLELASSLNADANSLSLSAAFRTYDHQTYRLEWKDQRGPFQQELQLVKRQGLNDYPIPEADRTANEHAQFDVTGLHWQGKLKVNKKTELIGRVWAQDRESELAPHIQQTRSEAEQFDRFLRTQLALRQQSAFMDYEVQLSYFSDDNIYIDPLSLLNDTNHYELGNVRILLKKELDDAFQIDLNLEAQRVVAESPNYNRNIQQNRQHVDLILNKAWKFGMSRAMNGFTFNNGTFYHSLLLQQGFQLHPSYQIQLTGHRNFRIPSLNDVYWSPGGNPNLQVERSESIELRQRYEYKNKKSALALNGALYYRNSSDWILWSFDQELNYWTPHNINQVRSQGIEMSASYRKQWKAFAIQSEVHLDYTDAEFLKAQELPRIVAGQRLYYIPEFKTQFRQSLKWKNWDAAYSLRHNSSNAGTLYIIEAFVLHNFELAKRIALKKSILSLAMRLENAFDTRYEAIERRPLAGRNFNLSIQYKFTYQ
ncbi:MAG: TonB-dependent receptor [Bacteroidota bacterium]